MKGLHPDKQTNQTRQCNVTPQSWENNASRFESFDLIDGKIRTLVLLALGFDQTQNIDPPE